MRHVARRRRLKALHRAQGGLCHYCRRPCRIRRDRRVPEDAPDRASLDHVIPRSRGGTNDPANLVMACWACNSAKGDRLSFEPACAARLA